MRTAASMALWLAAAAAAAQPVSVDLGAETPTTTMPEFGRRVRSIDVRGAWWARAVTLPIARCDVLSAENLSASFAALRIAAGAGEGGGFADAAKIRVVYVTHRADLGPGRGDECGAGVPTVGLTFLPLKAQVELDRPGDNVLSLPRGPVPALGDLLPAWRAVDPRVNLSYDRSFGTALALGAAWDDAERGLAGHAALTDSLSSSHYRAGVAFTGRLRSNHAAWRETRLRVAAARSDEPLVQTTLRSRRIELGLGATARLGPSTQLAADLGWQQDRHRIDGAAQERLRQLSGRVMFDATHASESGPPGFLRAALWADDGRSANADFRRAVARVGYAREWRVSPGQLLGVDVVGGVGWLGGTPSTAERFYGGNAPSQFLYDGAAHPMQLRAPSGPLLRSFGERQAALGGAGGRAFWHLNLNLAVPVRAWSQPLIPAEDTDLTDAQGQPRSIKQIMRAQVDNTGPALMIEALVKQGQTREAAQAQARAAFAEIGPAVRYVIDDAPLYAVRPLLLLDVANLSRGPAGESARWVAVGAGIGVTMVSARIEAGYLRTVSGPVADGARGAMFLRLVFENLF